MFHIAWIMGALVVTHWMLNTPKPLFQEWVTQVLFASFCFCIASFLESGEKDHAAIPVQNC